MTFWTLLIGCAGAHCAFGSAAVDLETELQCRTAARLYSGNYWATCHGPVQGEMRQAGFACGTAVPHATQPGTMVAVMVPCTVRLGTSP